MFTKKESGGMDQQAPAAMPAAKPAAVNPGAAPVAPTAAPMTPGKIVPSIIGTDLTVTGNVISKGEVQVDGVIQGDIHCKSLIVGEKAQITGGIVAEDVVVRGRVNGSIRGIRVTLQSNAKVDGDVFHKSIAIEQGAYFEGKSRRSDDPISSAPKIDMNAGNANGAAKPAMGAVKAAAAGKPS